MSLKAFFVATLSSALDLGIAVPDDVTRHVTPDVLAHHLPRPLWARLLTACLGAPRVDAQLIVETIGVPNLCEHIPVPIIWACIEEIAQRSLGGVVIAAVTTGSRPEAALETSTARPIPLAAPPPPAEPKVAAAPGPVGPSIPSPTSTPADGEVEPSSRARVPVGQRFRPSNTGIARLSSASNARRPQAQATTPVPATAATPAEPASDRAGAAARVKRGQTESDFELETVLAGKEDWKSSLAVEDEQLVEWSPSDASAAGGDDRDRKR